MGNCRKEVGVHCVMVKPEVASGSNECMGHHFGGWMAMLLLGCFWAQWPPPMVLPLWFSQRRAFRKVHCYLLVDEAPFPGSRNITWCSVSKGNYGCVHPKVAGPRKSPQSFIMKTTEQNLGSQQTTDGQGIKAELMPKWLTRAVDVWTWAQASKSHSPVTGTCATSYWNTTSGSRGNAPKRMLTN